MPRKLTSAQAAARLGVTRKTLYAYVSRGFLPRTLTDDGRASLFDPADIEALAQRGRPRKREAGRVHVSMASAITHIHGQVLHYRGHDAISLSEATDFQRVAMLLWTGRLPDSHRFALADPPPEASLAVARALPPDSPTVERFCAVTAALACERPLRADLREVAVVAHASELLALLIESLPSRARHGPRASFAARLWSHLSPLPPSRARTSALNRALVLLADHELATSTLAARVAASTRADPFAVVIAGLAAANGYLHGKAASTIHRLFLAAEQEPNAPEAVLLRAIQESGKALAGFGHPVYTGGDPRAAGLLCGLPRDGQKRRLALVQRIQESGEAHLDRRANVDFALGALAFVSHMPVGSTDAIFVLARMVGWVAHALEEYREAPLRFRGRATYEGR